MVSYILTSVLLICGAALFEVLAFFFADDIKKNIETLPTYLLMAEGLLMAMSVALAFAQIILLLIRHGSFTLILALIVAAMLIELEATRQRVLRHKRAEARRERKALRDAANAARE